MGQADLLYTTQLAFQRVIKAAGIKRIPVANVVKGLERPLQAQGEEKARKIPAVICWARNAEPYARPSGNRKVHAIVEVRANCKDTTETQFNEMVNEVFSVVQVSDLAAQLSGQVVDYTAFLVVTEDTETLIEGDHWVARWQATVFCAGLDISDSPNTPEDVYVIGGADGDIIGGAGGEMIGQAVSP